MARERILRAIDGADGVTVARATESTTAAHAAITPRCQRRGGGGGEQGQARRGGEAASVARHDVRRCVERIRRRWRWILVCQPPRYGGRGAGTGAARGRGGKEQG